MDGLTVLPACLSSVKSCTRAYSSTRTSTMEAIDRRSRSAAKRRSCLISPEVRRERVSSLRRDMVASHRSGVMQMYCRLRGIVLPAVAGAALTVPSVFPRRAYRAGVPHTCHVWFVTFDASLWAYRNSLKVGFQTAPGSAAVVIGPGAGARGLLIVVIVALSTFGAVLMLG